ncbi:MAG: metal-sensing transcriptional repressor, partial [Dehalococcoidia bacterium]
MTPALMFGRNSFQEGPHCSVPASFDPDQHRLLLQRLRRLVGGAEWLERVVREGRECHATLGQVAVLENDLRSVAATL